MRKSARLLTQWNTALFIHTKPFCLISKSNGVIFNQAIKELIINFQVDDNVISDKYVESSVKHEYDLRKVQSPLTDMMIYDLETYSKDRAVPYSSCIYKLSKISGKYSWGKTKGEYQKCSKDCVVFKGTNCFNEMFDQVL